MKKTGAVLGPLLKDLGLENGVRLARIRHDWYGIFDEQITSNLFPASLSEKELLLHVSSPIWMQQCALHKSEIIRKLAAYGIKDVRFRLGQIPRKKQKITSVPKAPITREESVFIVELLSGIEDEDLKDTIKKAAEKSLTSRPARQPR